MQKIIVILCVIILLVAIAVASVKEQRLGAEIADLRTRLDAAGEDNRRLAQDNERMTGQLEELEKKVESLSSNLDICRTEIRTAAPVPAVEVLPKPETGSAGSGQGS